MNKLEKALQSARPKEPSSDYLARGLAQIDEYRAPSHLVGPGWRFATIALAFLLVISLLLNVAYWTEEQRASPEEFLLVSSELRREGDLLIRETRYEQPERSEKTDE